MYIYIPGHDEIEYPLALQLGGCNPKSVGAAAYLAESYGAYESINLVIIIKFLWMYLFICIRIYVYI
jgi:hypothetical protein